MICWAFGIAMLLAGACSTLLVAAATRSARRSRARARLGFRADLNGQRLLQLADELERHAATLDRLGMPMREPRAWARVCRRAAVDHLACINALLLEPESIAGLHADIGVPGAPAVAEATRERA
ncbi:hypothetical protein LDO32_06550 [Luteimonas sp. Y-2-2-4F]|nr:hypothetical protein [Luteimonas sp. Y-2-2-4F]MCD9031386.1 hypothetical protein [Luteimonas sp. Y-2-2-4F]